VQSQRTPYVIDCLNLPDAQERQRSKILKETPWFSSVVPNISDLTSAVDSTHFLSVGETLCTSFPTLIITPSILFRGFVCRKIGYFEISRKRRGLFDGGWVGPLEMKNWQSSTTPSIQREGRTTTCYTLCALTVWSMSWYNMNASILITGRYPKIQRFPAPPKSRYWAI
jgi:hypothetical protein